MVIGAKHVDTDIKSALTLIDVISSIRGEVGEFAIALH